MKKILLSVALLAIKLTSSAQLVETNYRGAFEPGSTTLWTQGWASWTAQNNDYKPTTDNLPLVINTNTTLSKDKVYSMVGYTYVKSGTILTIEAGTVIRSTGENALIIERGAKIYANGTKDLPIVFTSNSAPGSRKAGDWGGVIICGAARHNLSTGADAKVEGNITAFYGNSDDNDSSGVFRYVRIEFPGQPQKDIPNSELNGLTLAGVGSRTKLEYIQVINSGDDSFEWFGGTVNAKYLVALGGIDDDFDTDNGYRGTVQFAVSQRNPGSADQAGSSNGFESDNDASGSFNTPITQPLFSNITIVGPKNFGTIVPDAKFGDAALIRRNSACSIINSILIGYTESGLSLDGKRTIGNLLSGKLIFQNNYLSNNTLETGATTFRVRGTSDTIVNGSSITSSTALETFALNSVNNNVIDTDVKGHLVNPQTFIAANVDFRPTDGSQLLAVEEDKLSSNEMVIFPNPASNNFEIALYNSLTNSIVTIQNAVGAVVATQHAESNTSRFDISNLTNGLYIVSVRNGNNVINKTLVINK
ncbi:MAG: T9SS type A sorting domain-containing protein [Opitutaceae bacterium]|nr:T9SS type A sorting domain-containing protein [Cytophagales bacterium]